MTVGSKAAPAGKVAATDAATSRRGRRGYPDRPAPARPPPPDRTHSRTMLAIHSRLRAALCGVALAGAALAQTTVNIPCANDNTL